MTGRTWLLVIEIAPDLRDHDWFAELRPVPDELATHDRIAFVSWPDRGVERRPMLAGTVSVSKLSRESRTLRLRHRVSPVAGHEIAVSSLGPRLAAARGWITARRSDLLGVARLVAESDFALIEGALLETAHAFGPPPKRPAHRIPRTPGRRALIAGRASVRGSHGGRP